MEQKKGINYCEEYSDQATAILKLLDGMKVKDAVEMLEWCEEVVQTQIYIGWKYNAEQEEKREAANKDKSNNAGA